MAAMRAFCRSAFKNSYGCAKGDEGNNEISQPDGKQDKGVVMTVTTPRTHLDRSRVDSLDGLDNTRLVELLHPCCILLHVDAALGQEDLPVVGSWG